VSPHEKHKCLKSKVLNFSEIL